MIDFRELCYYCFNPAIKSFRLNGVRVCEEHCTKTVPQEFITPTYPVEFYSDDPPVTRRS